MVITPEVKNLEETYIDLVKQIEMLEQHKEFLKAQIIRKFEKSGVSKQNGLQLVIQERTNIDDLAIKAILTPSLWNKIKMEKVDKNKLEAAIKIGEIEENKIDKAIIRTKVKILRDLTSNNLNVKSRSFRSVI